MNCNAASQQQMEGGCMRGWEGGRRGTSGGLRDTHMFFFSLSQEGVDAREVIWSHGRVEG